MSKDEALKMLEAKFHLYLADPEAWFQEKEKSTLDSA